jgi:bacillopeptidase F (M6 metalloprotease family)/fibronectin type 3 domain-containing protein
VNRKPLAILLSVFFVVAWTHAFPLVDSFEPAASGWIFSGSWGITDSQSRSPSTALTDSPGAYYANNTDSWAAMSGNLDLTAATAPSVSFYHFYSLESGYDVGTLEISTDGGVSYEPTPLLRITGDHSVWTRQQIDLDAYAGQDDIRLRFRLVTDGSVVKDGWYIDDLHVGDRPDSVVLHAVPATNKVHLSWSASAAPDFSAYRIYRSLSSNVTWQTASLIAEFTDVTATNYTDVAAAPKTRYYYRVMVLDSEQLHAMSNEVDPVTPPGSDFPFLDNGEGGSAQWNAQAPWGLTADPGDPANTCWSDSPDSLYTNSVNAALILSAPLDFTSAIHPTLSFRHKLDLLIGDILSVEVSITDGAEWISLRSYSDVTSTNRWTQENISLGSYVGERSVLIRFLLTTTPSGMADGCWIDDIAVAEAPSAVTSLLIDQVQSHSVRLNWNQNSDLLFSHYAIYRKRGSSGVDFRNDLVAEVTDQGQTQFTDSGLLMNSEYVYRVYAVSVYGTLSIVTAERSVLTENHPIPFADDFEGGTNGWVLAGTWNIESTATNSWLSDSPGDFYGNNQRDTDNYALTAVDLSGAVWPVLSFRDKFSLVGIDRGYLQISVNGTTWFNRYVVTGERTEWAEQQIDLSEWAGQPNVRIRFYLYSDGSLTADGWQIDDLAVTEHTSVAQSLPLYERFEAGATNWLKGGWVVNTNEAYEGLASAESLPIPFTPAYSDIFASYGRALNLSGSTAPQLTLWAKGIDDGFSRLYVQLSNNGGRTWTDISGDMDAKPGLWKRFQFAVPAAFQVDGVRLRLRAYTHSSDRATQFFVDKLSVEEAPTWVTLGSPVAHLKSIDLDWSDYADAGTFLKYEVYRRETAGVTVGDTRVAVISNRTESAFTDSGLSIGKTYFYKVFVYNLNDTATGSNEGQATTVPVELPIQDRFDDLSLWDTIGGWGIETNATESWLSDSVNSPYTNNQRDTDNYALTAVDLSGAVWPVLSFRDKFSLVGIDRGYLQISVNGTTWFNRYVVTGERTEWADQQIDLSEWAGQPNVRIRFYLYSDGSLTADGWQIDDLSVTEHTSVAQSLPLYERFEAGATNWLKGGWVVNTNEAYEGAASAESLPIPFSPAFSDIFASYGRVLNLSGSTAPQLTLWAKGIDDGFSRLYVQLSNNGGRTWTDISGDMDAKPGLWKRFQFAVPAAFQVDGVRLRLRAYTHSSDRATQFFVDKLSVEEAPTWVTLGSPVAHLKSIDLDWSDYADAGTFLKYEVYRRETAGVTVGDTRVAVISNRTESAFTDSGLSIGKTYFYKVFVYNLNDTATGSNEGQATTVPVELPIQDRFDDLSLWDTIGGWGIETNATESWLSDSVNSPYTNNQRDTDNYALTAVDLSGAVWPVLSFRDKFSLVGIDRGYLQISVNGTTWFNRYVVTGERTEWAEQQIDLSEWAGQPNVRIRFYLYSDGSLTADGWQIDDLSVTEHTSVAQSLPLYERFEAGATNWLKGGWVVNTNEAYEGAASAESLPIPFSPAFSDIFASYGRVLNLSGSTAPQLTLWAKGIDDGFSRLYVQLSNNGGRTWTDISGDMDAKPGLWKRFQFAVPAAFQVDGVRLRLRAYTHSSDRATQFFVDKLSVEEAPTWVTLGSPVAHLKSIDLDWSDYADAGTFLKYEVYRRETAGVTVGDTRVAVISNRTESAFTDSGLSIGKTYFYKVFVYNLNDTATGSNEGQATTVPVELPIQDRFDDLSLWDTIGGWGIETNATESWLSDSVNSPYTNNQRDTDNYALTAVDLSGAVWPVLSFRDKFSLVGIDRGYLQISVNGTTWFNRYVVTGERTEWADQQIDLSEWAGQPNVRIRFYLYSDGSLTADGWQIDDLSVTEHTSVAQSLPLYERFEAGATNWLKGGWVVNTNEAYEGAASAESLPIPFSPAFSDIFASYGRTLNLSGSTAPQLTLWAKGIDDGYSRLYVQLSNNGGRTWTDISGDMDAKPGLWKQFQFAVPAAFQVDGVRLRLRAYTHSSDRATQFFVDRLAIGEVIPSAPIPQSPADGAVVSVLSPTLTVINAVDIMDDNGSYEFEVYTTAALSTNSLVTRLPVKAAGDGTTSWQVDVAMQDGEQYWWRSRATSSSGQLSEWSATNTFHVVLVNNAPSVPGILSPYGGATLPDETGSFIWMGSTDSDAGDAVAEYQLEIAATDSFAEVLLSAVETEDSLVGVMALNAFSGYESLPLNAGYFWRIRAVDSHGLGSAWAVEPFVYGELKKEPDVIDPVTITDISIAGDVIRLEWSASAYAADVEFTSTLNPVNWQPVMSAQNIQTNYVVLNSPTNSPQGFFRVLVGD